jgi:hypothetical protein
MEQIIYWTGATALILLSVTTIAFCLWLLLRGFSKLLWQELKKNYNLMQLNYFMNRLEKNGRAWCVEETGKPKDHS